MNRMADPVSQSNLAGNNNLLSGRCYAPHAEPRGDQPFMHDAPARQVAVFTVTENRQAEGFSIFKAAPHYLGVFDRFPVIRQGDNAGCPHITVF